MIKPLVYCIARFTLRATGLIAEQLNITYTIKVVSEFGRKSVNGSWTGAVGMVMRSEADVGVADFVNSKERGLLVDFLTPYTMIGNSLLIQNKEDIPVLLLLNPFHYTVWLTVLMIIVIFTTSVWFIAKVSHASDFHERSFFSNFTEVVFIAIEMFTCKCSQGICHADRRGILEVLWGFMCMAIMTVYSANLIAVLSSSNFKHPINSFEDAINSDEYTIVIIEGGYLQHSIENSDMNIFRRLRQKALKQKIKFVPREKIIESAKEQPNSVMFANTVFMRYQTAMSCQFKELQKEYYPTHRAFIVRKNFPYRRVMNRKILQLIEAGEIEKMEKKYRTARKTCKAKSDMIFPMRNMWGVLLFAGCTFSLATVVLLSEVAFFQCVMARNMLSRK